MNSPTSGPGIAMNTSPASPRNTMLKTPVRHTELSARSGRRAPRFCPTKVAAAFDNPHAGNSEKITIRIAIA